MESYFKVETLENLSQYRKYFTITSKEEISIDNSFYRILGENIITDTHIPGFTRSTMDGYAVLASDTFGASESSPLFLEIKNNILMGNVPDFAIESGKCASIGTGGMLPKNSDSVIMIEDTSKMSENEIEIFKSISPGTNTIQYDDDYKKETTAVEKGSVIDHKNIGVLAACGKTKISVYKKLKIGIISTGDEIIEAHEKLSPGKIRDINRYLITGLCVKENYEPVFYGVAKDNALELQQKIKKALNECDMVVISGGSSVGMRDITIEAVSAQKNSEILIHGLAMSPGKPAIIARADNKPVFGLPGHPTSCFCVFFMAILPFARYISGAKNHENKTNVKAHLTRNIYSAPGRTDFIRVELFTENNKVFAKPILGESGLIRPLAKCSGLLEIPANKEGGKKDEIFSVYEI